MLKEKIESVYACDVYTFWEDLYFLEAYGKAVYVDGLGFRRWELLDMQDDGQRMTRRVLLEKPLPNTLSRAIRKLAGDSTVFMEDGVFDRSRGEYTLTLTSDRFKSNGHVRGWVRAEPHREGCLRTVQLEVDVHMLGMGRLLERTLLDAFASGYRDGVQYGNAFLKSRLQPIQSTPGGPGARV